MGAHLPLAIILIGALRRLAVTGCTPFEMSKALGGVAGMAIVDVHTTIDTNEEGLETPTIFLGVVTLSAKISSCHCIILRPFLYSQKRIVVL